jgi:hypothetical protein
MRRKFELELPRHGGERDPLDIEALLHPARAFAHPMDVVCDPDLTLYEKRAILASWASDSCAVEAEPALRRAPGGTPVLFDDVMDALRSLDRLARPEGRAGPRTRPRRGGRASPSTDGGSGHALT